MSTPGTAPIPASMKQSSYRDKNTSAHAGEHLHRHARRLSRVRRPDKAGRGAGQVCALHGLDGRVDILVAQPERERSVLLAPMARHGRSACSANGGEPARELRLRARRLPGALLGG